MFFNYTKNGHLGVEGNRYYKHSKTKFPNPAKATFRSPGVLVDSRKVHNGTTNREQIKEPQLWFLVRYIFLLALKTPIEEWTTAMGACYFWIKKIGQEAFLAVMSLWPEGTLEVPMGMRLYKKYRGFRDLCVSNPTLAKLVLSYFCQKTTVNIHHQLLDGIYFNRFVFKYKPTAKFFARKQKEILKDLGLDFLTPKIVKKISITNLLYFCLKNISFTAENRPERHSLVLKILGNLNRISTLHIQLLFECDDISHLSINYLREIKCFKNKQGEAQCREVEKKTIFLDTERMYRQLNRPMPVVQSYDQVSQLHVELIDEINREKNEARYLREKESYNKTYCAPKEGDEFITFLDNRKRLDEEGKAMHHCVASYYKQCEEGKCFIYHVEVDGEKATLELRKQPVFWHDEELQIAQLRGVCNNSPSENLKQVVNQWFHK